MLEKMPDFHLPNWAFSFWRAIPFKYKSINDFENAEDTNPMNYSVYEMKFYELAFKIFEKDKWDYIKIHLDTFQYYNNYYRRPEINKPYQEQVIEQ